MFSFKQKKQALAQQQKRDHANTLFMASLSSFGYVKYSLDMINDMLRQKHAIDAELKRAGYYSTKKNEAWKLHNIEN